MADKPTTKIRSGKLMGMGFEVECLIAVTSYNSHEPRPSIQGVAMTLPDGNYTFTDGKVTIPFIRYRGRWL